MLGDMAADLSEINRLVAVMDVDISHLASNDEDLRRLKIDPASTRLLLRLLWSPSAPAQAVPMD